MVTTTKLKNMPCIVADDILAFDPNGPLSKYANTLSGSFTYPSGKQPCSIMVNRGVDIFSFACHAWLGFPETVICRYKDGKFAIKKCRNTSDLLNRENILWAVGGMGLMNFYNPTEEGFCMIDANGKPTTNSKLAKYNYSDVLRKTNHTILGIKNNECYLVYVKSMTGKQVDEYAKSCGFQMAIMLDGGHIAAINGSQAYAKINLTTNQGYALQGIDSPLFNGKIPPTVETPAKPVEVKPTESAIRYTVQRGDTLSKIGVKYGVSWKKIADDNGVKAPLYIIRVGQVLLIKK